MYLQERITFPKGILVVQSQGGEGEVDNLVVLRQLSSQDTELFKS